MRSVMASNVLSGSNHEGASANAFSMAAVIDTPLELTLVDAVADDDDKDDDVDVFEEDKDVDSNVST